MVHAKRAYPKTSNTKECPFIGVGMENPSWNIAQLRMDLKNLQKFVEQVRIEL